MKNPLWQPPERWIIYGSPTPRPAQPKRIDEALARLLTAAKRKVQMEAR